MSITITPQGGGAPVPITPIAGSLSLGGGHDDRGGGKIPNTRAGLARNGSFEALISDTLTVAVAAGLRTAAGGHADVTGELESYDALVDVEISGDAVQIAKFTVKGTTAPAI